MRVLITGGAGFIGSNLAHYLANKGHKVHVYDNFQRGSHNVEDLRAAGCEITHGELDDLARLLVRHSFDRIFHFAAQVAVTTSYHSPGSDFRINAEGTFRLVTAADSPVIFASTNKVYGSNVNDIPLEEHDTRYDFANELRGRGIPETFSIDATQHTPYGISKLVGELYVREFGGVANRFSCVYGPRQAGTADQGWIAHFLIAQLREEPITIYGDGKQVRDILFVDDAVRLLEIEMEQLSRIQGQAFNIGGGYPNTISLLELMSMTGIRPSFADWRPADQKVYYSDTAKAQQLLEWAPQVTKQEGVERLARWVHDNRAIFLEH